MEDAAQEFEYEDGSRLIVIQPREDGCPDMLATPGKAQEVLRDSVEYVDRSATCR